MHVENKNNCCGCAACYNACSQNAIKMVQDNHGFYKPIIDKSKCINCGLCDKICPLGKYQSRNYKEPKVFAFQNSNLETLYKSASGGAFGAFAGYVIQNSGVVYGAAWNEDIKATHIRATNFDDIEKMHSSKYVQSDVGNSFRQAKKDLNEGKFVLFTGTPCQIAGLKSYLQRDYDNLLTIDLICHGVPSPLIFEKYKRDFTNKLQKNEVLTDINFRSKIKGWTQHLTTTTTTTIRAYHRSARNDNHMRIFLSNLSLNDSCFDCEYNKLPRCADITIGDFWGVESYKKVINDNRGLSVILLNSEKGSKYFGIISEGSYKVELPLDYVVKFNPNIVKPSLPNPQCKMFWQDIEAGKNLEYCVKKYCKYTLKEKICNILPPSVVNFIRFKILKRKCN